MPDIHFWTTDEYKLLLARLIILESNQRQLENRMQISEQQQADLIREVDETKAALTSLSTAYVGVRDALAAAQAEIAALGQPSTAIDAAIAALNDEQAKVVALLSAGGGSGPVVA
jgi:predicted  nucleic acid-binding Zn-ribbon protein